MSASPAGNRYGRRGGNWLDAPARATGKEREAAIAAVLAKLGPGWTKVSVTEAEIAAELSAPLPGSGLVLPVWARCWCTWWQVSPSSLGDVCNACGVPLVADERRAA